MPEREATAGDPPVLALVLSFATVRLPGIPEFRGSRDLPAVSIPALVVDGTDIPQPVPERLVVPPGPVDLPVPAIRDVPTEIVAETRIDLPRGVGVQFGLSLDERRFVVPVASFIFRAVVGVEETGFRVTTDVVEGEVVGGLDGRAFDVFREAGVSFGTQAVTIPAVVLPFTVDTSARALLRRGALLDRDVSVTRPSFTVQLFDGLTVPLPTVPTGVQRGDPVDVPDPSSFDVTIDVDVPTLRDQVLPDTLRAFADDPSGAVLTALTDGTGVSPALFTDTSRFVFETFLTAVEARITAATARRVRDIADGLLSVVVAEETREALRDAGGQ